MSNRALKLASVCLCLMTAPPLQAASFPFWSESEQEVFFLVNLQRELNGLGSLTADNRLHAAALTHSTDMSVNNFFNHIGSDGSNAGNRIAIEGYNWNQQGGGWGENIAAGFGATFASGQGIVMLPAQDSARLVMYGSADIGELNSFSVNNGFSAFDSWDEVGMNWNDDTWDAWHSFKGNNGGWMGSSGHRGNILTDWFTDLGVGLVFDSNDQTFANSDGPFYSYWTQNFAAGDTAPVPLPAAFWLLTSGIVMLSFTRNKRTIV